MGKGMCEAGITENNSRSSSAFFMMPSTDGPCLCSALSPFLSLSLSLSLSFSLSLALLHKSNYLWRIFCAPRAPRPLIMPGMSCKVDGQFESGISISKQVETKLYLSSFHPPFKISASNKSISLQTSFCGMHQVGRSVVGVK